MQKKYTYCLARPKYWQIEQGVVMNIREKTGSNWDSNPRTRGDTREMWRHWLRGRSRASKRLPIFNGSCVTAGLAFKLSAHCQFCSYYKKKSSTDMDLKSSFEWCRIHWAKLKKNSFWSAYSKLQASMILSANQSENSSRLCLVTIYGAEHSLTRPFKGHDTFVGYVNSTGCYWGYHPERG